MTATITPTLYGTPSFTPTPPQLILILKGSYPDPARAYPDIIYWLSRDAEVTIKIWTVSGEIVLLKQQVPGYAGYNSFQWNRRNRQGKGVASGVFIYEVLARTGAGEKAKAMSKLSVIR